MEDKKRKRVHPGRRGFKRWLKYQYLKLVRINDTPEKIAAGLAFGVVLGILPTFGVALIIAIFLSGVMRVNRVAAVIGTLVMNPWTATFFWALSYITGSLVLGNRLSDTIAVINELKTRTDLWRNLLGRNLLLPYIVGNLLISVAAGAFFYVVGLNSVRTYRKAKKARLARRAEKLRSRRSRQTGT